MRAAYADGFRYADGIFGYAYGLIRRWLPSTWTYADVNLTGVAQRSWGKTNCGYQHPVLCGS